MLPDRYDLLWGLVGALGFLALLQGYELLANERVAVTSAASTRVVARRLVAWNESA